MVNLKTFAQIMPEAARLKAIFAEMSEDLPLYPFIALGNLRLEGNISHNLRKSRANVINYIMRGKRRADIMKKTTVPGKFKPHYNN